MNMAKLYHTKVLVEEAQFTSTASTKAISFVRLVSHYSTKAVPIRAPLARRPPSPKLYFDLSPNRTQMLCQGPSIGVRPSLLEPLRMFAEFLVQVACIKPLGSVVAVPKPALQNTEEDILY